MDPSKRKIILDELAYISSQCDNQPSVKQSLSRVQLLLSDEIHELENQGIGNEHEKTHASSASRNEKHYPQSASRAIMLPPTRQIASSYHPRKRSMFMDVSSPDTKQARTPLTSRSTNQHLKPIPLNLQPIPLNFRNTKSTFGAGGARRVPAKKPLVKN